jgi:hypothetical protein
MWSAPPGGPAGAGATMHPEQIDMNINGNDVAAVEVMAMKTTWRHLAIEWELTWNERRALFPAGGEDRTDPPADTERRMRILIEVGHRLAFDDHELCDWLRRPSELWNWYSPLEVMSGTLPELRRFRAFIEQGLGS